MLNRSLLAAGLAVILLSGTGEALAQQEPTPHTPPPNPSTGGNLIGSLGRSNYEVWLTGIICVVGIIIIILLIYSITRHTESRPEDMSRPIIVITVIISTLILVTAGYSNEQIAPAFGLFGTIIGYILGRLSSPVLPSKEIAAGPTEAAPVPVPTPK